MNQKDGQRLPDDLQDVDARLRAYKPEVNPLELDRIKLRAMAQSERRPASRLGRGIFVRSKMITLALVFGLVTTGGTAGVIAGGKGGGGDDDHGSGGKGEYCPPKKGDQKKGDHGNRHCTTKTNKSHKGSHNSHGHHGGKGHHNSHGNGGGKGHDHKGHGKGDDKGGKGGGKH
jgi:hypothetical protein